ncbi:hypothetical protein [Rhizobium rhizogenes]|uniref:hypothetical protein n=1 Tax=Rhizobium rhizogenes TaxID=359 RepID=UPI0015738A14|nr:hypothetical protein [Rhizobium rhizogenes]NTI41593.1 hypothetical protein [Rhizobium rhizogenes]
MTDEIDDGELARLRAKWGIVDLPKAEASALAKVQAEPRPIKVLVRKERVWAMSGMHFRWFFIGINGDGSRRLPFTTTHTGIAYSEVQRYQKAGVPMEVLKEVEFE